MRKHVAALLTIAAFGPVLSAAPVYAQPATGGAANDRAKPRQPVPELGDSTEFQPRSPGYEVAFSLEEADLSELVRVIAQLTGKRFILEGKVKQLKASVYSPQKVTVAEAYQAFLSILAANNLTVVPRGRFLKIVDSAAPASSGAPVYGPTQAAPNEDRYVTRMHRLAHVSADDAAAVLSKFKTKDADITVFGPSNMIIITETGTNIRRMMKILDAIDTAASGDRIWIEPIHYASAQEIEKRINELFDVGSSGPTPAPASERRPRRAAAAAAAQSADTGGAGTGDLHISKVIADDRTNSLIIVATERSYERLLELINRLDVPQTGEGEIHVLPLQHADATELAKTLNDIVSGAAAPAQGAPPRGARPATQGTTPGPAQVFEGGIKISADKATNSIVITSSLRDYAALRAVIERLDQPRRQVFIEAVIMDVQLKRSNTLGVSFHGGAPFETNTPDDSVLFGGNKITNTIPPVPADPEALQGFALGVRGPGITGSQNFLGTGISIPAFGAFIQAIATTGDTDLLSTPHILALDNEDAEINVGDNVPLQTNQGFGSLAGLAGAIPGATGTAGAAGAAGALGALGRFGFGSFGVPRQDVGTKIKIKPHVNDSDEVRLEVTEEISEVGANVGGTSGAFSIGKRSAKTKLVVKDQQTVVIGGLIRNVVGRSEEKVPVLGDIPVLGALFRKRTNQNEKRNLILILTPYIIRSQQDLRTVFERKMQERQEYLDRYFVFSDASEYTPPKDWSRTVGLVENIRQAYFAVEEKRRLEEIMRPKKAREHEPQRPLETPHPVTRKSTPSSSPTPTPAPPAVRPTPPAARPTQPAARPTQPAARPTQPAARPTPPTR